jgi:phospholipase C
MIVISPWSKGGWVDSEVFDHTSLIRFIEQRFGRHHPGLIETNITPWRRAVVGDLTSAFDFDSPNEAKVSLPSTSAYVPPDATRHPSYVPVPPTTPSLPKQEPGVRPSRRLPYELHAHLGGAPDGGVKIHFRNTGRSAAVFQVRAGDGQSGPWTYTVAPADELADTFATGASSYDLSVYGPNGFFREFKGALPSAESGRPKLAVKAFYHSEPGITLEIENIGLTAATVSINDAYALRTTHHRIEAGRRLSWHYALGASFGWYDLTIEEDSDPGFRHRVAGHVENGQDSVSDPAFGR